MLSTDQKGTIAEAEIVCAAARLGVGVFKAVSDGERYDLIFDLRPTLVRVQCKWARRVGKVVVVRCYSCRRTRDGQIQRPYTTDEIDVFAAYCADIDQCYLLPVAKFAGRRAVHLRLGPALNNQRLGVNWAKEFEIAATLSRLQGP